MSVEKSYDIFTQPPLRINKLFPETETSGFSNETTEIQTKQSQTKQSQINNTKTNYEKTMPLHINDSQVNDLQEIDAFKTIKDSAQLKTGEINIDQIESLSKNPIIEKVIEPELEPKLESKLESEPVPELEIIDTSGSSQGISSWVCFFLIICLLIILGITIWYYFRKRTELTQQETPEHNETSNIEEETKIQSH